MFKLNEKYLFTVTHCRDDSERLATPLALANDALAAGGDVLLWLTVDATELAKKGAAEGIVPTSFPPVSDLLDAFQRNGGRIGVSPPCAKTRGVTDENMVENGEWLGAAAMLDEARDRQAFSF